jgi:DNA-binding NarL/FixJ family response regulator
MLGLPRIAFAATERTMSEPQTSRRRVLVVDDNPDVVRILGEFIRLDPELEFIGSVGTGSEALDQARLGAADVFILDLSLRDSRGFGVLERLHAQAPGLKLIVHTAHSSDEHAAHAKRMGAAAFVVKDGNVHALLNAVRTV